MTKAKTVLLAQHQASSSRHAILTGEFSHHPCLHGQVGWYHTLESEDLTAQCSKHCSSTEPDARSQTCLLLRDIDLRSNAVQLLTPAAHVLAQAGTPAWGLGEWSLRAATSSRCCRPCQACPCGRLTTTLRTCRMQTGAAWSMRA